MLRLISDSMANTAKGAINTQLGNPLFILPARYSPKAGVGESSATPRLLYAAAVCGHPDGTRLLAEVVKNLKGQVRMALH